MTTNHPTTTTLRMRLVDAMVILLLSALCVITSYKLKIDHNAELIGSLHRTLSGHPWAGELQNRLLAPWLLNGLDHLTRYRVSSESNYKVVRMVSALFAFGTVYLCTLSRTRSYSKALVAAGLCAYGYLWTALTFFMEYPDDLFDIGFMYLLCWLCVQNLVRWVLPVMLLACLNRESGMFGGLIYASVFADLRTRQASRWKPVVLGLAMTALACLFVNAVRYAYAGHLTRQHFGIIETVRNWRWGLQPFGSLTCLAGMFLPVAMFSWTRRGAFTGTPLRIVIAAGLVLLPTMTFGIAYEIRVFLPVYTMLVFALMESGFDLQVASVPDRREPFDEQHRATDSLTPLSSQ